MSEQYSQQTEQLVQPQHKEALLERIKVAGLDDELNEVLASFVDEIPTDLNGWMDAIQDNLLKGYQQEGIDRAQLIKNTIAAGQEFIQRTPETESDIARVCNS